MDTNSQLNVTNRQSFVKFLSQLHDEYRKNGNSWENNTLGPFLEAMTAYAEDIQGYYDNTNQDVNADVPSWKVFTDILKGATNYE